MHAHFNIEQNTYSFLSSFFVVNKEGYEDAKHRVKKFAKKKYEKKLRIKLKKCQFAKIETECLGYHFSPTF